MTDFNPYHSMETAPRDGTWINVWLSREETKSDPFPFAVRWLRWVGGGKELSAEGWFYETFDGARSLPMLLVVGWSPIVEWHPMSERPVVSRGAEERVIGCWRMKDHWGSRIASGELTYLQRARLDWAEDDDRSSTLRDADGTTTGWYERYEGRDGDVTFEPISDQFVTHLGWAYFPVMPEPRHG